MQGIYIIDHPESGRVYVGSSCHISRRWYAHKYELRHNKHSNPYLQAAWNKYLEASFSFRIIEEVKKKEELFERERFWVAFFNATSPEFGFNINLVGYIPTVHIAVNRRRSGQGQGAKVWEGLIDPDGNEVPAFTSLYSFCKERGLSHASLRSLFVGSSKVHQGYTHKNYARDTRLQERSELRGRPKLVVDSSVIEKLRSLGLSDRKIAAQMGINRMTVARRLKQ